LIARIKKKTVTPTNQIMLNAIRGAGLKPKIGSRLPAVTHLVTFTMCVNGRIAIAMTCALAGKVGEVRGKKVPAKKSIGVMKRKEG
jgi:hypothetical protein